MSTPLPAGFSARPPTPADAPAIAAAIAAAQAVDQGAAEMTAEELLADWTGVDLASEAVMVLAPSGDVAGEADLVNRGYRVVSVYGSVTPVYRGLGIGRFLVDWGEHWARDHMRLAPADARVVVQHYLEATNESAHRLLAEAGYSPVRPVFEMTIELDDDAALAAPPEWPAGIVSRPFVPGRDEVACHAAVEEAFRDVWGRPPGSLERFVEFTKGEAFDPALWWLAWDGNELAGVALGRAVAGSGWIDSVAVRPAWRRRGLGLALLRQAFAAYQRRGIRTVGLSVDAESATGASRLYLRAGMRVLRSHIMYRKEIRPGLDVGET